MHATKVRELKKNPSRALRLAQEGPVLILKGNEPDAIAPAVKEGADVALR